MAETDARHLQEMERLSITSEIEQRNRGQNYGLIIGLAGFGTSIVLGYLGHPGAAATVGGVTLVSLVSIFVLGKILKQSE
jgi:hypothetical protein